MHVGRLASARAGLHPDTGTSRSARFWNAWNESIGLRMASQQLEHGNVDGLDGVEEYIKRMES